jgi:hypothetical protein
VDRRELIDFWQGYLCDNGIPTFPLFGVMNGACRCRDGALCKNPGKHPKAKGWRDLTAPIPVGLHDNVGASTDSLVVVDIDSGTEIPSDLPETFTVSTGRGLHLWYWADPSHPISNATGWRPKIDIRSVGGLVAAPPSRHVSGAEYTWIHGEITKVPGFILETQKRYERREKRPPVESVPSSTSPFVEPIVRGLVEEVGSAPEGERNSTLFRVLCRFFELAASGWAGEDALRDICSAAIGNGLDLSEIERTAESSRRSLSV